MAPSRQSRRSSVIGRAVRLLALAIVGVLVLPLVLTLVYAAVPPVSTLMLWRWATGARVERVWTPIEKFSPALPLSVIAAEDARFCTHHGIDFAELRQAIEEADDLSEARGGSTITQQTAKNLFLWQLAELRAQGDGDFRWRSGSISCCRSGASSKSTSTSRNGARPANSAPRPARGVRSASRAPTSTGHEAALLAAVLPNSDRRDARRPGPGLRRLAGTYQAARGGGRRRWPIACDTDPSHGLALPL